MARFVGQPTAHTAAADTRRFTSVGNEILEERLVLTREEIEWSEPHPDRFGHRCYRLYVRREPRAAGPDHYTVVASMGVNDSMKRELGPDREKALKVYFAVNDWTMRKTLRGRGFRTW